MSKFELFSLTEAIAIPLNWIKSILGIDRTATAPARMPAKPEPDTNADEDANDDIPKDDERNAYPDLPSLLAKLGETERCMKILNRNKAIHKNMADLLRSTGIRIGKYARISSVEDVANPTFVRDLPSFGAVSYFNVSENFNDNGKAWPSLVYFERHRKPTGLQPFKGAIYSVTDVFPVKSEDGKQNTAPSRSYFMGIAPDGSTHLLKQLQTKKISLPQARGKTKGGKSGRKFHSTKATVTQRLYDYPAVCYVNWRYLSDEDRAMYGTAEAYAQSSTRAIFSLTTDVYSQHGEADYVVRAAKKAFSVRFNISLGKTPYFFRHRIKVKTQNGRTKPVYHWVEGHDRINTDGSKSWVRSHTRGLNVFEWKGYKISILKRDHDQVREFTPVATHETDIDFVEQDARNDNVSSKVVAQMLALRSRARRNVDGKLRDPDIHKKLEKTRRLLSMSDTN